jgi:hypothetical protein
VTCDPEERWSRNPDVVFRTVAGERLLVPVRGAAAKSRRLFTLNPLGASVWELLERERSFRDLSEALQKQYPGTPPGQVEEDTHRFLTELAEFGLLYRNKEGAPDGL